MRQWPAFNEEGDLPPGIHEATIGDVLRYFGTGNLQRQVVARRLEKVYHLARGTGYLARFIVFGSFITAKPEPNDVDIFILMEDMFDVSRVSGEGAVVFDHMAASKRRRR